MAATDNGNTGAMQIIWTMRTVLNVHTLPAAASRASGTEDAHNARTTARRAPARSASRGVAKEPTAVAIPAAKRIRPPDSSGQPGALPRGGNIGGRRA